MAQQVKALTIRHDDPSFIPRTYMVEEKNHSYKFPYEHYGLHIYTQVHTCTYI